jgi:uncharacterized protein
VRQPPTPAVGRERIAIVGSGIAGLACAHVLGPHHDVVLYEAAARLGGHSNTVDVEDPAAGEIAVDTGFIVHNDRNYPNLVRLFEELGVHTVDTEMSFAVTDRDPASPTHGFTYRATSPNTVFADRRNLVRPPMWRMLRDITRFYRDANAFLESPEDGLTLAAFLDRAAYGRELVDLHLVPMGAAVWSADPATFAEFPARSLLTFLSNHGLLGVRDRPQWRTIPGGSRRYVQAIADRFAGHVHVGSPVLRVERDIAADGRRTMSVVTRHGRREYDRVVLAVHSDQALRMLAEPSAAEREVLGAVRYQPNLATLHTDTSLLSPRRRAWAAWNYDCRPGAEGRATVTYDMTTLQHLPGSQRYLVSLNSDEHVDPAQVLQRFEYEHPFFDTAANAAQARFEEVDGVDGVHFCGAWWGHGFHEDGMRSGLRVCERIGVAWPAGGAVAEPHERVPEAA